MTRKVTTRPARRLKKKEVTKSLIRLFEEHPGRTFSVKELFSLFAAANHPAKMIIMDSLNELLLDDYIATDGEGGYRNAIRSNVMEGTFQRKATTPSFPTTAARASWSANATRSTPSTATASE